MNISDPEPGCSDTRFAGASTGKVQVGRFILDVPSPGGTTLSLAPRRARTKPPPELTKALAHDTVQPQQKPVEPGLVDRANQLLDTAEAVTDKVEHATDTVQALLAGRIPDPEMISGDLVDWLALMQRLAQSGRFAEVIKLGRPVCRLLGLTLRWAALVESLRLVFRAATALADTSTIAWTEHELGTLHGSVGDVDRARELLGQARRSREAIGDGDGLRATNHNLKVLSHREVVPKSSAALVGVGVVVLIAAVLVVAKTVSGGSSPSPIAASSTSSHTRTTASRSATTATRSATTSSSTRTTTATVDSSTTKHSTRVQIDSRPLSITPAQVSFGTLAPGATSDPQTITLANGGQTPETVTSVKIGTDPTDFSILSDDCGGHTVAPQSSCAVVVSFAPSTAGSKAGVVSFTDSTGTRQVGLSGVAASPPGAVPRPRAVTFPTTTIGQSAPEEIDLLNDGAGPLTVTSAQLDGASAFAVTSNTCAAQTVAAGALCTVTVEFTPTAAGEATATLTFTDDADPTTQQVQLFATGEPQAPPTTPATSTDPASGQTTTQPPRVQ